MDGVRNGLEEIKVEGWQKLRGLVQTLVDSILTKMTSLMKAELSPPPLLLLRRITLFGRSRFNISISYNQITLRKQCYYQLQYEDNRHQKTTRHSNRAIARQKISFSGVSAVTANYSTAPS